MRVTNSTTTFLTGAHYLLTVSTVNFVQTPKASGMDLIKETVLLAFDRCVVFHYGRHSRVCASRRSVIHMPGAIFEHQN